MSESSSEKGSLSGTGSSFAEAIEVMVEISIIDTNANALVLDPIPLTPVYYGRTLLINTERDGHQPQLG